MKSCDDVRELLVLHAERQLEPGPSRKVEDHLDACADCRKESERILGVLALLRDPELFRPRQDMTWEMLPASLAARVASSAAARRWLPLNFGSHRWALAMAATLVLGCGAIWRLHQPAPWTTPAAEVIQASGNEAFLARIEAAFAKEATAAYLNECRDLLVHLLHARGKCEGEQFDVSLEVARAQQLLQRKRLLGAELARPEVARARALCDEIENFLVNLSTSQSCARPEEIRRMERFIEREQLLLRINLLQSELS